MTITEPSLDLNKDTATLAWEKSVTEATNRMQHQIDNINESVNTSPSLVAVYARTLDGKGQQFTPFEEANGYVAYVPYTDAYPTLPLVGVTFAEYSNEPINFVIKQYRETMNRPSNPGSVQYTVSNGSWTESQFWDKTKLNRSGTNIWFCEARIIGAAGEQVTAKWSDPKLLYGGAVATGILYYNVAQTGAPSAPSVDTSGTATGAVIDGYDYDTGIFSLGNDASLSTLNWQYVPITVAMSGANSINKKHWQVSFHIETLEVTNETGNAPGQIITFGTVEGFIPIGSVLQSDNYSGSGTLAGWQINRSGNADFNNVNIRGNSTVQGSVIVDGTVSADAINASQLSAISADLGTITAGSIDGGTITAGDVTVTGGFSANQLSVGVIVDTINGAAGRGNASTGSSVITTFTSNNSTGTGAFDTDALIVGTAVATSTGNSGQGADDATGSAVSLYLYQNGTPVSGSGAASATASGGGTPYGVGAGVVKVQLAKNTVYEVRIAWSNNGMGYSGGGSVTYGLFEVRRT